MISSKINVNAGLSRLLPLVIVLMFLVMQNSSLQHSHDGDLSTSYDCEFCLQISSSGEGITAECNYSLPKIKIVASLPQNQCKLVSKRTTPNSRAPPQLANLIS